MRASLASPSRPVRLAAGLLATLVVACGSEVLVVEDGAGGSTGGGDPNGSGGAGGSGGTCVPQIEICDAKDNDCDGQIDEPQDLPGGCSCSTGETQPCYSGMPASTAGVGQCQSGTQSCADRTWGACAGEIVPLPESCNGLDDDCNGFADDVAGIGEACQTGAPGVCADGVVECVGNGVGCSAITPPSPEACDGLDNDCNGQTDEGDPGGGIMCNTGLPGLCASGTLHCLGGTLSCMPAQASQMEICNGIDDDCNGVADDGDVGEGAFCNTGQLGVCADGTITCVGGSLSCVQDVQPSAEVCGNATDEDCDGDAPVGPTVYFNETFANNAQGWALDTEWGIGSATASACGTSAAGNDPGTDHTASADNGIAGIVIGGCYTQAQHADRCITSPTVDLSSAPGTVLFSYWRHLHADYPPFISSHVDVSSNGGATWQPVYAVPSGQFQNDAAWTQHVVDVTAQKSAAFRVRFCYSAGSTGIFAGGGWNVDDVQLSDALCQ